MTQRARIAQPFIYPLQLDYAAFVFFRRVIALVEMFEFVTALTELFQHDIRRFR